MTELKIIIGSGSDSWCSNCEKTASNLKKVLAEKFSTITADIEHINVTKPDSIKKYGTLLAPALIINDLLVNEGSVPSESIIEKALQQIVKNLK